MKETGGEGGGDSTVMREGMRREEEREGDVKYREERSSDENRE